jgi:CubicO group peptidase (beta-lactamase class C family)
MLKSYPSAPPSGRPVYSSIAFSLLAFGLEEATGKNYTQMLRDLVSTPLGMASTRESPGNDDKAVIPPVDNSWGSNYDINAP